jgi:pentatricopeptide repeat protein
VRGSYWGRASNAYILYRAAHCYAELGSLEKAVELLRRAVESGFLSVQIMLREENCCALGALTQYAPYGAILTDLSAKLSEIYRRHVGYVLSLAS